MVKTFSDHHCELQHMGKKFYLHRWDYYKDHLRSICQLWDRHYLVNIYFQSTAAVEYERKRHKRGPHPHIIHPMSKFAFVRECLAFVCYTMVFFIDPFFAAFEIDQAKSTGPMRGLHMALGIYLILESCMTFFTGYVQEQTREVIDDPHSIATRHLKTYFVFDILGSLPMDKIYMAFEPNPTGTFCLLKAVHLLRNARIKWLMKTAKRAIYSWGGDITIYFMASYTFLVIYTLHFFTCLLFFVPYLLKAGGSDLPSWTTEAQDDWGYSEELYLKDMIMNYMFAMHTTVSLVSCSGDIRHQMQNDLEYMLAIVMLVSGLLLCTISISTLLCLVSATNVSQTKYVMVMKQINAMFVDKHVNPAMRERVNIYMNALHRKKFFDMGFLFDEMSESLKVDMLLYDYSVCLRNVPLFSEFPKVVLEKLLMKARKEYYMVDEVIINTNEILENIYIISYGTVVMYFQSGEEWCHKGDGDVIGDSAYANNCIVVAAVMAIETSELIMISIEDIEQISLEHPEVKSTLITTGAMKIKQAEIVYGITVKSQEDYVAELTKCLYPKTVRDSYRTTEWHLH